MLRKVEEMLQKMLMTFDYPSNVDLFHCLAKSILGTTNFQTAEILFSQPENLFEIQKF